MINDGTNRYVYDPEGRICAVWSPGPVYTQYVYDANGQRVAKGTIPATDWPTAGNTCNAPTAANGFTLTAQYLRGQSGDQDIELTGSGQLAHQNIFEGGGLAATYWNYNSPAVPEYELSYNFNDWLGSKRLQTNNNPSAEAYWRSDPYGNYLTPVGTEADATGTTAPIHFTGKERDTESGNDYFGARYYASSMGRWMSPDYTDDDDGPLPIPSFNPSNPQSLNLYAYVGNNPLSRVDADGHDYYLQGGDQCGQNGISCDQQGFVLGADGNRAVVTDQALANGTYGANFDANGNLTSITTGLGTFGAQFFDPSPGAVSAVVNSDEPLAPSVQEGIQRANAVYQGAKPLLGALAVNAMVGAGISALGELTLEGGMTTMDLTPDLTEHAESLMARHGIAPQEARDAIQAAKKAGNVVQKLDKYGRPKSIYRANGIEVVESNGGRNAGRIITAYHIN